MNWIIDRIEEGIAVCEVGTAFLNVPVEALPEGVKEGDVITLSINKKMTDERKENIAKLMNNLFKN